jgi:thioesterase domain-containing protein/acyl carrier protein
MGVALFGKVKEAYGLDLDLSTLFEARTVRALAQLVRERAQLDSAPATKVGVADVEGVLTSWWKELLNVDQVGLDQDFFDLGGHSLMGVALFGKVKEAYGLDLDLSTLFEARTVRALGGLIRQHGPLSSAKRVSRSHVVPIQPKGKLAPIYVISGIGGNVVKFHRLAFHLGEDQPIYGLLPRGLDGKDSFHSRIEDMATDYVNAIQAMQPDGPYHLVGYSFGGTVAFEVAQQIVARKGKLGLLGLLDTIEPTYIEKIDKSLSAGQRLDVYTEHLKAIFRRDGAGYLTKLVAQKSAKAKRKLMDAFGRPLPQAASIEESNFRAAEKYRPVPYPGRLTLFRSMERSVSGGTDEMLGWGELAGQGVEIRNIPCNHFNILREPAVKVLADEIRECLRRG